MTHQELSELYELYALGVLDGDENQELEDHLARKCPECELGVRQAFALGSCLAALPEPVNPPKRLKQRIMASIGAEPRTSRLWTGVLAALGACLLIGVVLLALDRTRREQEMAQLRGEVRRNTQELSQARAMLDMLNLPETRQVVFGKGLPAPPKGRIFVHPQQGVLLIASNLPPPPAGKTYQMWLVPKTGAPARAGLFQSDARGNAFFLRTEPVDLTATKAVAVTLEPEAGSTTPTMPLVLAAGLE